MIIRSQNKKYIIKDLNLEVVTNTDFKIKKISFDDDCQEISGDEVTKSKIYSSTGLMIGEYSTEQKAIKVLDMIEKEYGKHFYGQGGELATANFYVPPFAFIPPKVFQMPADNEVEV